MIKKIGKYTMVAATLLMMASCSQEEMLEQTTTGEEWLISVGEFPGFDESDTRAVGTYEAGKSTWEKDDKIMLVFSNNRTATLTRDVDNEGNPIWTNDAADLELSSAVTIKAVYAPNHSLKDGEIVLNEGAIAGTDEYFEVDAVIVPETKKISINFSERAYSRLRLVGEANTSYTVSITDFTPAGETTEQDDYSVTLNPNTNGNIFLYGSWKASTVMTIPGHILAFKSVSEKNVAYVANLTTMEDQKSVTVAYDDETATATINAISTATVDEIVEGVEEVLGKEKTYTDIVLSCVNLTSENLQTIAASIKTNAKSTANLIFTVKNKDSDGNATTIATHYVKDAAALIAWKDAATTAVATNLVLLDDVDMQDYDWKPTWNSSKKFSGTVDGNGKTIKNIKMSTISENSYYCYYGFITYGEGCTIQNLTLEAPVSVDMSSISSEKINAGFVVGYLSGTCTISNVKVTGSTSIKMDNNSDKCHYVGGIVGFTGEYSTVSITNCSVGEGVTITMKNSASSLFVGGIVGYTDEYSNLTIESCSTSANITSKDTAGGIIGGIYYDAKVTVNNCVIQGCITGASAYVGQIYGWKGDNAAYSSTSSNTENATITRT